MKRLLNSTSLHFILSFVAVILAVVVLILVVVGYLGEESVMIEGNNDGCLFGEIC